MDIRRPDFRVIAEGDDAVGRDLTLAQALALLLEARRRGKRHVAIVDDTTGTIVDERSARTWISRKPPPLPGDTTVPCPACEDEGGEPSGDVLVQLPSGTWVRDTCDLCHGTKRVDQQEVARRSVVFVDESPTGDSPTAPMSRVPRIESGTRHRVARVLVVDDEPRFVEAMRLVLSDEFEVTGTADARQALTWMTGGDWYDVVLCDVMMPFMNGVELRNRVHTVAPDVAARIVFLTGGVLYESVRRLIESVPNTCLEKPVDLSALRELIRRRTFPGADSAATADTRAR